MSVRKLGVEEELMLVDPATGQVAAVAERAVRARTHDDPEVEQELFLQQIETATPPCLDAADLEKSIRAGRRAVGQAAAEAGAEAVAVPTPIMLDVREHFTRKPRYQRIGDEYGETARQSMVCAMHMHVEITDDAEGVAVIDRIRPWLPVLLALSANSPYWWGRDTGHASWRSQVWGRWPTSGPQEPFGDVATYRHTAARLMEWGAALDPGMLYFDVRLAERYPTVEVRVADVCTETEDAVLVALLARALVQTCTTDEDAVPWRADLLRAAGWRAGRHGLAGHLVHPVDGHLAPVREVFGALVDHTRDALDEAGDLDLVTASFERLLARGNGAGRQRAVHEATGDLRAVVADLARRTRDSWA